MYRYLKRMLFFHYTLTAIIDESNFSMFVVGSIIQGLRILRLVKCAELFKYKCDNIFLVHVLLKPYQTLSNVLLLENKKKVCHGVRELV